MRTDFFQGDPKKDYILGLVYEISYQYFRVVMTKAGMIDDQDLGMRFVKEWSNYLIGVELYLGKKYPFCGFNYFAKEYAVKQIDAFLEACYE